MPQESLAQEDGAVAVITKPFDAALHARSSRSWKDGHMSNREQLQQQIEALGDRYLRRTIDELLRLRELIAGALDGDAASLAEMHLIVHKIHGSGAMFGFDGISEAAARLERAVEACVTAERDAEIALLERCDRLMGSLELEVHNAAQLRGVL
jgi:HPt (histidine-containing phosphotransfer) domain-containing protein